MGIRTQARVRKGSDTTLGLGRQNRSGKILKIDLVNNARTRWNYAQVAPVGSLGPFEKFEPLLITLKFSFHVASKRTSGREIVDLNRMVDDHVGRNHGVDYRRIHTSLRNDVTHCRQVNHNRTPGVVLHHNPSRHKRDFGRWTIVGTP